MSGQAQGVIGRNQKNSAASVAGNSNVIREKGSGDGVENCNYDCQGESVALVRSQVLVGGTYDELCTCI